MEYDITKQYWNVDDIAYWGSEPVKVYEVDKMGNTPDHCIYYWVEPVLFISKVRVSIYKIFWYIGKLVEKITGSYKIGMKVYANRFVNRFFWFPGHALMAGTELFKTPDEYLD
jgi:hypothetical protein